jgi:hypothetical protein
MFGINGGDDGARTRDLCRDRAALQLSYVPTAIHILRSLTNLPLTLRLVPAKSTEIRRIQIHWEEPQEPPASLPQQTSLNRILCALPLNCTNETAKPSNLGASDPFRHRFAERRRRAKPAPFGQVGRILAGRRLIGHVHRLHFVTKFGSLSHDCGVWNSHEFFPGF